MKAMRVQNTGGQLVMDDVPVPSPDAHMVRLSVAACGVNFADTLMITGRYQESPEPPFAPGMEVCGIVEALGDGVTTLSVGQRVAALCGHGGFAEKVCAPAANCMPVPDTMGDAEAAALQITYGTSHVALNHRARLQPGERLLVLGAAGGVGLTAVEIGKLMGAEVIAVARGEAKQTVARQRGADHVLEADPATLRAAVRALGGADVVYDPVGGDLWREALRATNPEGRLLPIGFASGEVPQIPANILLVKNLTVIGLYWGAYRKFAPDVLAESMAQLLAWWEAGQIKPHVSHVLPLSEAETALDLLRQRTATGKVVLEMGRSDNEEG